MNPKSVYHHKFCDFSCYRVSQSCAHSNFPILILSTRLEMLSDSIGPQILMLCHFLLSVMPKTYAFNSFAHKRLLSFCQNNIIIGFNEHLDFFYSWLRLHVRGKSPLAMVVNRMEGSYKEFSDSHHFYKSKNIGLN